MLTTGSWSRVRPAWLLVGALALAACSSDRPVAAPLPSASAGPTALPVGDPVTWLCRPTSGGLDDAACREGLDAAVVTAAGTSADPFEPPADPPVDCFYVYPTVSRAPGVNAPAEPAPEVVATVRAQAALLGEACRLFVPLYRQVTLGALTSGRYFDPVAQGLAQSDVVDAWHEYLNEDNDGRGVVLVGHSQGAMQLARLLEQDAAPRGLTDRVVSALLVGGGATTAAGSDVADEAGDLPVCREVAQTGCVLAYSTFAEVPPAGSLFGRAPAGREAICVDPTRLSGGDGALHPYVPTDRLGPAGGLSRAAVPAPDGAAGFVAYPGAGTARCRQEAGASWLHVERVPGAPVPASLTTTGDLGPAWGLHTADVNLALGDLVDVVRRQGEAWAARG